MSWVAVATTQFPASSDWALAITQSTAVIASLASSLAWPPSLYWLKTWRRIQPVEQLACSSHSITSSASWFSLEDLNVSLACVVCMYSETVVFILCFCVWCLCVLYWRTVRSATYARVPDKFPPPPTISPLSHSVLSNITCSCVYIIHSDTLGRILLCITCMMCETDRLCVPYHGHVSPGINTELISSKMC
jgi:hypothetical protein